MCLSCRETHETINWCSLFHASSPFSLPQTRKSWFKAIDKPLKLRCKASEYNTSWLKTTVCNENAIVHTYSNSPLKGDTQNYTCKSYLEALFLAYIGNPLKGNFLELYM